MEVTISDSIEPLETMKARPYQAYLLEIAVQKNTIIHLPTGSGKTFIAISLINRLKKDLQKPWGAGGKRSFFLVNNVPLVYQQKKAVSMRCPVDGVGGYTSEDRVDYWDKQKWDAELSQNQVIVMTSQILANMLTHQYIQIDDINLLIFDECHHAVVDHPMRVIMKHFEGCTPEKQPRVLGLTATLLNANASSASKVEEIIRNLETTFHATVATINNFGEVDEYSTNPKEFCIYYAPSRRTAAASEACALLKDLQDVVKDVILPKVTGSETIMLERNEMDISSDPKKITKGVANVIEGMIKSIDNFGTYGGSLGVLAYVILMERLKRKALSKEESFLYKLVITQGYLAQDILQESMQNDSGYDKIIKNSSEQVKKLLNVLKEYNPDNFRIPGFTTYINLFRKDLSGIVFTKQRFTSKILYNLLKEVIKVNPKEFGFIKHDFVVGFNLNPMNNTREQYFAKKTSQQALLKFNNGGLNLLISTSVLEEGVDIPQCALVMRFDRPMEYRSYLQSKGRARCSESSFVIMISEVDRTSFLKQYRSYSETYDHVERMLVGKTEDRAAPTIEDIEQGLYEDDEIPPYISKNGCRLQSVAAISLLNRYCSMLPHDQFSTIAPKWICKTIVSGNTKKRVITIMLPIASVVKEPIHGAPFINLKTAKRSAALNACKKLHEVGELHEVTMLPKPYGKIDFEMPDIRAIFPNWPWDEETPVIEIEENSDDDDDDKSKEPPKPGTRRRSTKSNKVFPTCLNGPKPGQTKFYLHVLRLKTNFEKPTDSRELALYELLQCDEGYGFITANPLPIICDFPMFLTVGEVMTKLEGNYATIELNPRMIQLVKRFHLFIYDQVLSIAKRFVVFDDSVNCLYTVPVKSVNGQYQIDWNTMNNFTEIAPVTEPSLEERRSLKVTSKSYKNFVVSPWYRCTVIPDRYIVSNVLEDKNPSSQFSTDDFPSYASYFYNKYNLEVYGPRDQPLLEVRNITSRMNCLLPRSATINTFSDRQKRLIAASQGDDNVKGFKELFVPEFCIKYDYPGVLWYKGIMLPSIVHRITMILVAEELRSQIAAETKIGKVKLSPGMSWQPLDTDMNVARASLLKNVEKRTGTSGIDRINIQSDPTAARPINVRTMKEVIYELQKKKIHEEFPWDEKSEPVDIDRNLTTVTLLEIECYDEFVSKPLGDQLKIIDSFSVCSPKKIKPNTPPPMSKSKIHLLSRNVTSGPELKDVLAALTARKANDNFDLERAETLGDAFLKFAATLYLFHKFPKLNEGQLTNIKGRLIGNRNLFYAGERINLGGRMNVEHLSPRSDFLIPGFFVPKEVCNLMLNPPIRPTFLIGFEFDTAEMLSGKLSKKSFDMVKARYDDDTGAVEHEPPWSAENVMQSYMKYQAVNDKTVADCVEALVGTYLLNSGVHGAVKILEWFRVLPKEDNFIEYLTKSVTTVITEGKASAADIDHLLDSGREQIERIIDYTFKDSALLLEAMSHPSYIRNRYTHSYERLEFLGDAIMDFLITSYIFENSKYLGPGDLTNLRSALVNNVTFASYVVRLGLHKFLCSDMNPILQSAVMYFAEHQEKRNHEVIEEVLYLIDESDCNMAEYVEVPKALSDIFESLVGAIYLDTGGDLQAVWNVMYKIMYKEIEQFIMNIPKQPVQELYEMEHACATFGNPKLTNTEVPKTMIAVTVSKNGQRIQVYGIGNNKFQAKRAAAKLALRVLNN